MSATLLVDPIRLRRARLEASMSQRDLARAAGVSPTTVTLAEAGRQSTPRTIRRLAAALGIPPSSIATINERTRTL